jgi:hypothetical protein
MFRFLWLLIPMLFSCTVKGQPENNFSSDLPEDTLITITADSLRMRDHFPKALERTKTYLEKHSGYNNSFVFLIDMKRSSGSNRFFIVDLKTGNILEKGLVAHGSGSETSNGDSLIFSNIPNSYMTSLGFYKIGAAYTGSFGRSYKLHGLEATNNKALERAVVLHRYSCVPDDEQSAPICNSLGCPMVSELFFLKLDTYIRKAEKPVLMYIYY